MSLVVNRTWEIILIQDYFRQIESRKIRDDGNGTLTIRGVREKHEGKYSCKVTGNYKVPAIGTATLGIARK